MLSTKSPEFLAFIDDTIERILLRMCTPAHEHFIALNAERIEKITRITNGTAVEMRRSIRRLADAGRITEETREIGGRTVRGVVCLPLRKRPVIIEWTEADLAFLRSIKVAVEEPELVPAAAHTRTGNNTSDFLDF